MTASELVAVSTLRSRATFAIGCGPIVKNATGVSLAWSKTDHFTEDHLAACTESTICRSRVRVEGGRAPNPIAFELTVKNEGESESPMSQATARGFYRWRAFLRLGRRSLPAWVPNPY